MSSLISSEQNNVDQKFEASKSNLESTAVGRNPFPSLDRMLGNNLDRGWKCLFSPLSINFVLSHFTETSAQGI